MKYAVDYTDSQICKINTSTAECEFHDYQQFNSFKEAKASLIDYWDNVMRDAKINRDKAKKIIEANIL